MFSFPLDTAPQAFIANPALVAPLLRTLTHGSVAAGLVDPQEMICWTNPVFDTLLLPPDAVLPVPMGKLIEANVNRGHGVSVTEAHIDVEAYLARLRDRLRKGPFSFPVDQKSGAWLWMTHMPMADGWNLILAADITPLKSSELALRVAHDRTLHASRTDPLTELPNRRYAMEMAEHLLHADIRGLSLAVLDLDWFKEVNDQHGHQVGDEFLCHFTREMAHRVRDRDRLCRLGGDEFLLLLPGAQISDLALLARRLHEKLPPATHPAVPGELPVSFSAGLAACRPDEDLDSLLRRADRALYAAKRAGRGRVVIDGLTPEH